MRERAGYQQFVQERGGPLFRVAFLMCGHWHEAQDLVQATLVKVYIAWHRIEHAQSADAYARKVLLRTYLSQRRVKRSGETPIADLEHLPDSGADRDLQLTLVDALRRLPPRNRAVVVLRYLEDHSIDTVAQMLDTTPAAVKSLNTRSLAQLREHLGADRAALFDR